MTQMRRLAAASVGVALAGLAIGAPSALAASTVNYQPAPFGSFMLITGEADDDLISVSLTDNTVTINDAGTGGISTADVDCANAGGTAVTCPFDPPDPAPPADPNEPVTGASFALLAGNDSFSSSAPFTVGVSGGEGDDSITGGPDRDELDGGNGNDTVLGGDGDDELFGGGSGFTTGGTDLLDGQGGVDGVSFGRTPGINVSLNGQPDDGFPGENDNVIAEQVFGGEGDDFLTGNAERNLLDGSAGNDLLTGLEGNDTLRGSVGDDGLVGGPQKDQVECDESFDTAIVDPRDVVDAECERTGAQPGESTAKVSKKRRGKVPVSCPLEEANPCVGNVVLLAGATQIGSGAFSLAAGASGQVGVKLTKKGAKTVAKSGAFLASVEAQTTEPIGTSVKRTEVLLTSKPPK